MAHLTAFNTISLDGYFTDANSDMSWAHTAPDPEWQEFVNDNATGGGLLVYGRITYQMMAGWWPTPMAAQMDATLAAAMNAAPKLVFSRTLTEAAWNNTRLVKEDLPGEIRRLKAGAGPDMAILGSGTVVTQLAREGLIDLYQLVVSPVVLGAGRTPFEGLGRRMAMKRTECRAFGNGNVLVSYAPA